MVEALVQRFKHFSLKRLTIIGSTITVILFLAFTLAFKLFWQYGQDLQESFERQMFEVERVETVLHMEELELRASLEDYAAWTTLADYVDAPSEEFIRDSIGPHAFQSALIDSAIIFSPSGQVVWQGTFDGKQVANRSVIDLSDQRSIDRILFSAMQTPESSVHSFVKYARIGQATAMIASSRICLSDASNCNHGYMVFIRRIRAEFIEQLELATGVGIRILPPSDITPVADNTHIMYISDIMSDHAIRIEVSHNEKLPAFIAWQQVAAVSLFSLIMFVVNLYVVNFFIKPFTKARKYLLQFHNSGGKLPSEDSFVSKEARDFACQFNSVITELEQSRALLKQQSIIDSLTGIANRRHLYDTAKTYIESSQYSYLGVVIIDIDHFKLYNDTYGHIAGDKALTKIAQTLQSVEIAYPHLVARYGGEEFCIVIAAHSEVDFTPYVRELVAAVKALAIEHSQSTTSEVVTVSVGATAAKMGSYRQFSALIQTADYALYQVKHSGRNNYKMETKHIFPTV